MRTASWLPLLILLILAPAASASAGATSCATAPEPQHSCFAGDQQVDCDAPCTTADGDPLADGEHAYRMHEFTTTGRRDFDGSLQCAAGQRDGVMRLDEGGEPWSITTWREGVKHGPETLWVQHPPSRARGNRVIEVIQWEHGAIAWSEARLADGEIEGRVDVRYRTTYGPDGAVLDQQFVDDAGPLQGSFRRWQVHQPEDQRGSSLFDLVEGRYHGEVRFLDAGGKTTSRVHFEHGRRLEAPPER